MGRKIKIVASAKILRDEKNKRHDPTVKKVSKFWSTLTVNSSNAS